jgi:lipoate synthase
MLQEITEEKGFMSVASGLLVRSSHMAEDAVFFSND